MKEIIIDGLESTPFFKLDKPKYNSKNDLELLYWLFHPRFGFFKNIPINSKLLDIGAASGNLSFWKSWEFPNRSDIEMYAIDMNKGEFFDEFVDFQIMNLDEEQIKYEENFFDAIFMSHVIEHLKDGNKIMNQCNKLLKKGGRIYIETPTVETLNYPSKSAFSNKGINTATTNFFDDHTHCKVYNSIELQDLLKSHNLTIIESGIINNRYLEDELFTYGMNTGDESLITYSVWSKLNWAHYVVGEK